MYSSYHGYMSIILILLLRMQEVFKSRVTAVIHSVADVEYARLHPQKEPAIAKLVSLVALVYSKILPRLENLLLHKPRYIKDVMLARWRKL